MLHIERLSPMINALSERATEKRRRLQDELHLALAWLLNAPTVDALLEHLEGREDGLRTWTGALPHRGLCPNQRCATGDLPPERTALVAVDGSQIYPDRHAAVLYYLLQIGGVVFRYNGEAPVLRSREALHYEDTDLFDEAGLLISTETIGIERLNLEARFLAELADEERTLSPDAPVFAFLDSPLLWSYPDRGRRSQDEQQRYLEALSRMRRARVIPAGYIDRPGGQPVIDLLAALHSPRQPDGSLPRSPWPRLSDRDLMAAFLQPGQRSAWFARSSAAQQTQRAAGHEICFSYLNAGDTEHPVIARVEVPCWAVDDATAMAGLQSALIHQAQALGGYPYALARAHEEALITTQDKVALEATLQRALLARGMVFQPSEKARQKSYLGHRGTAEQ